MIKLLNVSNKIVDEYFKTNDIIIIPTGAVESHGPHNPLGTDVLVPNKILELMEDRLDVLVTPTLPFGSSDAHTGFSGTITLSDDILYEVLKKITYSMYKLGAKKFVFLNGHGGNTPIIKRICLELNVQGVQGAILDWWRMVGELDDRWKGGHGGAVETSAVMYIDDSLVDKSAMAPVVYNNLSDNLIGVNVHEVFLKGLNVPTPRITSNGSNLGWFGPDDPVMASKELGEEMLNAIADYYVEFIKAFNDIKL